MNKIMAIVCGLSLVAAPLVHAEKTQNEKKARKAAKREEVAGRRASKQVRKAERAQVNRVARRDASVNRQVKAEKRAVKRRVDKAVRRDFRYNSNRLAFNTARASYFRTRHDRGWWNSHYSRFVVYGGGYWYWNSGWWYPAYGYNPGYNSYVYDGPVYGYGYINPAETTVRVQRALAERGFYYGPIDGIIGPGTRNAIRQYQVAAGLAVTSVMDEPTLATLGLV